MSWQGHIKPDRATYQVDAEMRQMIGEWFEETYGINPGCLDFDEIGENFCKVEIPLASPFGNVGRIATIALNVQTTGRVEQTLIVYPKQGSDGKRVKLPDGQLPPDKETVACRVSDETIQTWINIPAGWHPAHEQIIAKIKEYAKSNSLRDDVCWIGGWYPDGTETRHMGESFPLTPKGLRDALTTLRADLKGGLAWVDASGEQDEGPFCMMILPGCGEVPDDDRYLILDPTDYSTIISNHDDDDCRWENVLPM